MIATDTTRKQLALEDFAIEQAGALQVLQRNEAYLGGGYTRELEDRRLAAMENKTLITAMELDFRRQHLQYFSALSLVGEENVDFVLRSRHWTPTDEEAIIKQGRKPYKDPILLPYARAMLAEEIGQRTEWRAKPKNGLSGPYAELQNHIFRMVAQQNKVHRVYSGCYKDGLIRNIGVSGVRLDPDDPDVPIKVERYRPQEFMWDVYSSHDSLDGSMYLWRGYLIDKSNFALEFPAWAGEIMQTTAAGYYSHYEELHTLMHPKVAARTGSLQLGVELNHAFRLANRFAYKREFYERIQVAKFMVRDGYRDRRYFFDTIEDAELAMHDLRAYYAAYARTRGVEIDNRIGDPKPVNVPHFKRYIFCGDLLIDVQTFQDNRLPYQFFIPEYNDGEITSFFQHLKDPQRLHNVMLSIQHQVVASHKGWIAVNEAKIPAKDRDGLDERLAKPSGILKFNDQTGTDIQNWFRIVHPPNQGSMAQAIDQIVTGQVDRAAGGTARIGVREGDESGAALSQRRSAASAALMPTFDVYSDFKQAGGERVLVLSQQLDPLLPLMAEDESGDPIFKTIAAELTDPDVQSLAELSFKVTVNEVVATPSERDFRMLNLMEFSRHIPSFAEDAADVFMKYSQLEYSDRKAILEAKARREQAAYEAWQREQARQDADSESVRKERLYRQLIDAQRAQNEAENRPKTSMSLKLPPSPGIMSTLFNKAGMETHPIGFAADNALDFTMKQEQRNIQQAEFYENTPAWARKPQTKSGVETPTDSAARADRKDYSE